MEVYLNTENENPRRQDTKSKKPTLPNEGWSSPRSQPTRPVIQQSDSLMNLLNCDFDQAKGVLEVAVKTQVLSYFKNKNNDSLPEKVAEL